MDDKKQQIGKTTKDKELERSEFSIEEFSIVELEDRLELASRCNKNCGCP